MVIDDLHILGIAVFAPSKADTPLIVDANAVLPFPVAAELLETVARYGGEGAEIGGKRIYNCRNYFWVSPRSVTIIQEPKVYGTNA